MSDRRKGAALARKFGAPKTAEDHRNRLLRAHLRLGDRRDWHAEVGGSISRSEGCLLGLLGPPQHPRPHQRQRTKLCYVIVATKDAGRAYRALRDVPNLTGSHRSTLWMYYCREQGTPCGPTAPSATSPDLTGRASLGSAKDCASGKIAPCEIIPRDHVPRGRSFFYSPPAPSEGEQKHRSRRAVWKGDEAPRRLCVPVSSNSSTSSLGNFFRRMNVVGFACSLNPRSLWRTECARSNHVSLC